MRREPPPPPPPPAGSLLLVGPGNGPTDSGQMSLAHARLPLAFSDPITPDHNKEKASGRHF